MEQGATLNSELQDQLDHQVAVLRESHVKELLGIQEKIENVSAEVAAFNNVVDGQKAVTDRSALLHKQSAAILALEGILQTSQPFAKHLKVVQDMATETEDALILAVLSSFPAHLPAQGCSSNNAALICLGDNFLLYLFLVLTLLILHLFTYFLIYLFIYLFIYIFPFYVRYLFTVHSLIHLSIVVASHRIMLRFYQAH